MTNLKITFGHTDDCPNPCHIDHGVKDDDVVDTMGVRVVWPAPKPPDSFTKAALNKALRNYEEGLALIKQRDLVND